MSVCLCCLLLSLSVCLSLCFSIFHLSPYIFTVKLIFFYFASPIMFNFIVSSFFLPYFPFYSTLCFLPFNESFISLYLSVCSCLSFSHIHFSFFGYVFLFLSLFLIHCFHSLFLFVNIFICTNIFLYFFSVCLSVGNRRNTKWCGNCVRP